MFEGIESMGMAASIDQTFVDGSTFLSLMLSESAYWLEDDDEYKEQILRANDAMPSAKRARYLKPDQTHGGPLGCRLHHLRQRLHSH